MRNEFGNGMLWHCAADSHQKTGGGRYQPQQARRGDAGAQALHFSYRLNHTTQLRITGRMEYFCIILLHSPRIGRAQSLPKEEVLRQQLRSEDAQQQVGPCSTAMIQDGREFLPDADADCAQELRVTLIVHTGCSMERRSAKKPTTSANQALWDR